MRELSRNFEIIIVRFKIFKMINRVKLCTIVFVLFLFYLFNNYEINRANQSFSASSSAPFVTGNDFLLLADYVLDDHINNLKPISKIKNGDVIFLKTEFARKFFKFYFNQIDKKLILITHNSDMEVSMNFRKFLDDTRIIVWFAQNPGFFHPKLVPIPIGFENSAWHPENLDYIRSLNLTKLPEWHERKILLYVNFDYRTNADARKSLMLMFQKYPKEVLVVKKRIDYKSYLDNIANSKFVLCPRGNGLDTHRFYETVLMGSIPVVENSTLFPLYRNSTVLVLDDLKYLTLPMLRNPMLYISNMNISRSIIMLKTWADKIQSFKQIFS